MRYFRGWRVSLLLIVTLAGGWVLAQTKTGQDERAAARKVDLQISAFRAERTGLTPAGEQEVRLTVVVRCFGQFPGAAERFLVQCSHADNPRGPFPVGAEQTVARLETGYGATQAPTATLTFGDRVRAGATHYYMALVDPTGVVDEAHESNNSARTEYRAEGCVGPDLILQQVELRRIANPRDTVEVRVWVRNRCLAECRGDLYFYVRPITPDGVQREHSLGAVLAGEAAIGPSFPIYAPGVRGSDLTYVVGVGVRSGSCVDVSPPNNYCTVVLRAAEDRRTITCY